ncbi:hypothetical protein BDY24DRAFT_439274 [Mrakia frigida]|uniref:uncharacterized protein n=1 Tax=Mrakia frigida TaxID=29902 RepID=UPI003FCC0B60
MSSYEDDHPSTSAPDVETASLSLDEILEEIEASDGGLVLVDENGRRMVGDGVVEMLAGAMGARSQRGASAAYISSLPSLTHKDLGKEDESSCGICQIPLLTLVDEEEYHLALDSPATSRETLGVVTIGSCSHLFCRRDASKWLSKSNSCPLCRSPCDPSQQPPSADSPAAGTPPFEPPFPGAPSLPPNQQQMMDMLQSMFGTGGGGTPDQAARQRDEEERESFSGMYS